MGENPILSQLKFMRSEMAQVKWNPENQPLNQLCEIQNLNVDDDDGNKISRQETTFYVQIIICTWNVLKKI